MGIAPGLNFLETKRSLAPTDRDSNTGSPNPYPSHQTDYAVLAVARVWIQHYAPTVFLIKQVGGLTRFLRCGTLFLC
jgi:hypothetical protein